MKIAEINGVTARCEARGVERDVNLFLLQDTPPVAGDFVMVHVGYAIQTITEEHARSAWEVYDEMLSVIPEPTDA